MEDELATQLAELEALKLANAKAERQYRQLQNHSDKVCAWMIHENGGYQGAFGVKSVPAHKNNEMHAQITTHTGWKRKEANEKCK